MLDVQIVLFDGFDFMDVIGPYEVFTAARMVSGADMTIRFVSAEGAREVKSGLNGPGLPAESTIEPTRGGILIVPGATGTVELGDTGPDAVVTRLRQASESGLMPLLRRAMSEEQLTVAAVCGGGLLLAMDGSLEDRYAVTHALGMDALGATGARPVPARVVVDGRLVTGGGVTSGLDVALYLVERELGPQISHAVEKLFEYERRGTVWHAAGMAPLTAQRESEAPGPEVTRSGAALPSDGDAASGRHFDGDWDLTIATPVGRLAVQLSLASADGIIRGVCRQGDETSELIEPHIHGGQLRWSLKVAKPMRLNLKFTVVAAGDTLTGTAKAGLLPASKVEGVRRKTAGQETSIVT